MGSLKIIYRDVDRIPYLFTLRQCARRYGLELDIAYGGHGRQEWEGALETGAVDLLAENYWGLQAQAAKGAPFVALGSVVNTWTDKLLVAADVHSVADLRGKKLAVRGLGPQQYLPALWLKDHGLFEDVEQVVYSEKDTGRWGHWKKVVAGECQACFVTGLYADAPLAAGLHAIPFETYGYAGNVTLITTRSVVQARREEIQGLVDASFDASHMFKTDAAGTLKIMREECLELLKQQLDVSGQGRLEQIYHGLRDDISDVPVPTAEGISNIRRMILDVSPELRTYNPLLMWDFTFARQAFETRATSTSS